jgi:hypothetical protein
LSKAETVITALKTGKRAVIPTTFVPLAPDRILIEKKVDVLFGLFHIMWQDMPRPRSYRIRLSDEVGRDGKYIGCFLSYDTKVVKC